MHHHGRQQEPDSRFLLPLEEHDRLGGIHPLVGIVDRPSCSSVLLDNAVVPRRSCGSESEGRPRCAAAEADNAKYDPHKEGSHFCDFCGVELAGGEYELLKDGRERCNHCSSTALRTGEEFKEVYKMVVRNMEIFFGIKLNVAIKVRMTDAKPIAKHFGDEFVATPGFDGRVLGFAQKDSSGYSLYIENGSP